MASRMLGLMAMSMVASATATDPYACGNLGLKCCNKTDCDGNALICESPGTDDATCVERTASHCGECCGEEDCPKGTWCTDDNKCEPMCGNLGAKCCGTDCDGNTITCDEEENVCVTCGDAGAPACPGNVCNGLNAPTGRDGKCEPCGAENKASCPFDICDEGLVSSGGTCVKSGACGDIGQFPCDGSGCDRGKETSAASGGVCVTSCGEPAWTCCDGESRCLRDTLTCVPETGRDQDGVPFTMACRECGGVGEPVCEEPGAEECEDDLVNNGGTCEEAEVETVVEKKDKVEPEETEEEPEETEEEPEETEEEPEEAEEEAEEEEKEEKKEKAVSCGGRGELPCDDGGCDDDKNTSAASGGVCVTSCGEPAWTCCDADASGARCLRDTLTCVPETGRDQDGVPFTMACRECGGVGEPACAEPGAEECEDDLVNDGGTCEEAEEEEAEESESEGKKKKKEKKKEKKEKKKEKKEKKKGKKH